MNANEEEEDNAEAEEDNAEGEDDAKRALMRTEKEGDLRKISELMRFIAGRKRLRWKAGTSFDQKRASLLASLVPNFRENCSPFRSEEEMAGS